MNIVLFGPNELEQSVPIHDKRIQHIFSVLKLNFGDTFDMGIINADKGKGTILADGSDYVKIQFTPADYPESLFPVTVVVGQIRPIKMKRILRELTTLGVGRIICVGTNKGEKGYRDSSLWKNEKYREFLVSGAEQAFTTLIPEIRLYDSCKAYLHDFKPGAGTEKLFLDLYESTVHLAETGFRGNGAILVIGSERGWSPEERKLFREYEYTSVHMGNRVLTTDTAAITAAGFCILNSCSH